MNNLPTGTIAFPALTALLYLLTALRFLYYRRNGARYRPGISLFASAIIAALIYRAIEIAIYHWKCDIAELIIAAVFLRVTWAAQGNLAVLFERKRVL